MSVSTPKHDKHLRSQGPLKQPITELPRARKTSCPDYSKDFKPDHHSSHIDPITQGPEASSSIKSSYDFEKFLNEPSQTAIASISNRSNNFNRTPPKAPLVPEFF